jgi:hypothetical protein
MFQVSFPPPAFRLRQEQGRDEIFDAVRRKWVVLTPEEWVRQNWLAYFMTVLGYPQSLIAVERELQVGERRRRFDVVVFSRQGSPWLLLECKAHGEPVSDKAVQQMLSYQSMLGCQVMLVSNGIQHAGWQVVDGAAKPLTSVPAFIG